VNLPEDALDDRLGWVSLQELDKLRTVVQKIARNGWVSEEEPHLIQHAALGFLVLIQKPLLRELFVHTIRALEEKARKVMGWLLVVASGSWGLQHGDGCTVGVYHSQDRFDATSVVIGHCTKVYGHRAELSNGVSSARCFHGSVLVDAILGLLDSVSDNFFNALDLAVTDANQDANQDDSKRDEDFQKGRANKFVDHDGIAAN